MICPMMRYLQRTFIALAIAGAANSASAFSLLGPFAVDGGGTVWQVVGIGYQIPGSDIGGPMNLGEEYRWNIKTVTYGFDESFLNYFGAQGTAAVMQAFAFLNALPPVSQMSSDLAEFPLESKRMNYQANALGLLDVKSVALAMLLEELGVASPERYVWTLRSRVTPSAPPRTNYTVIMRNFDPVTSAPSKYVNGTLYTYTIVEFTVAGTLVADAEEIPVDPLAFTYTAVVSAAEGGYWAPGLYFGEFFAGLTRDDVGSLRYLYRPNNYQYENLIPGTTVGSGGPWTPIYGTNALGSNAVVDLALRPGVDKIVFQFGRNDSIFGNFLTVTNQYTDTYVTNSTLKTQNTQRVLTQPDILFAAEDLGLNLGGQPVLASRSANWVDNNALNGQVTLAGPGQIQPQILITFSTIGPWFYHEWPYFLDEANPLTIGAIWGSFDGSTNPPIIYPNSDLYPHTSIQDLEQQVLSGH